MITIVMCLNILLKRDFETETISQKWCINIIYIHVQKEEWAYLASVMNLCSHKIIGYTYCNIHDGGTNNTGCKECVPECQGYRGAPPAQRPWKPVYEPGI